MQDQEKKADPQSKPSRKAQVYSLDVQSYNKDIKGFKIFKADKPEKESVPFNKSKYPTLSTEQRGWNAPDNIPYVPVGQFEEVLSAIQAQKAELPNTRKRLSRSTYRNIIVMQKRNNREIEKLSEVLDPDTNNGENVNRVTKMLQSQKEQKTLVELRKFAYDTDPLKTMINVTKEQTGHIRPKCEMLNQQMKEHQNELAM